MIRTPRWLRADPVLVITLAIAAFLLFYALGQRPLWQDEAETACLARNVLKFGLPLAYDGVNLVSQEEGREFGPDFVWGWSPWLQIYTAALSFRIAGVTTLAARLPFAFAAWLTLALTYRLARRHLGSVAIARVSAFLLATCVPFLLFVRQCRYYSIGALFTVLAVDAFFSGWQTRMGPACVLALSMGLLFHSNYLLFFSLAAGMGVGALLLYRGNLPIGRVLLVGAMTAVLVAPGLLVYGVGGQGGMVNVLAFMDSLKSYVQEIFQYLMPFPIFAAMLLIAAVRRRARRGQPIADDGRFIFFLGLVVTVSAVVLSPLPQRFFRYIVHLAPLCCVGSAWVILAVWRMDRSAGVFLGAATALTNWLHVVPLDLAGLVVRSWRADASMLTIESFPLVPMVQEMVCGYTDSNETIIRFLQSQAEPGDTVLATYGDLPLQFYTQCRVVGGLQPGRFWADVKPDWIVRRSMTLLSREGTFFDAELFLQEKVRWEDYAPVALPAADMLFENRADLMWRRFEPLPPPYKPVEVYRRREGDT